MKISKILKISLLLLLFGYFIMPSGVATPAGDGVLITEVLYDTPGVDGDEEWFELFNPTVDTVNLTGWKIGDNYDNYTIPLAVISSGGYLTIAKLASGFNALYGYNPDIEGLTLYLGNSGDCLTLYDSENVTVDFVAWEGHVTGWDVAAKHTTIRRINSTDTDTVGDWEDSTTIGDPGSGTYAVIIPEFSKSVIGIGFLLIGVLSFVGLRHRKKE